MNDQELQWSAHIKQQEASGLSIRAYCQQVSLNYDQFQYWRKKSISNSYAPVSGCIPVRVKSDNEKKVVVCSLTLKGGYRLEIHDAELVKELLQRCL